MKEKYSQFEVAQAALAIVFSLPWVLVSEAITTLLSLANKPVLLP